MGHERGSGLILFLYPHNFQFIVSVFKGIEITTGVPLECGGLEDFKTLRIGLLGLDKLMDIEDTITDSIHARDAA